MIFGVMTYLWLIYFISGRLHRFVCLPHQWHSLILSPTPSPPPVPPLPLLATTHVFLCGIYKPTSVLFCSVLFTMYHLVGSTWKRLIWGISFSIIPSKGLFKFLQTVTFHSLLVVESHSCVCVCVCVCVCLHAHAHTCTWIDRYRHRHTDFYHYVCTDVYLGLGVNITHTYVHIFFVPSMGTP